MATTEKIVLKCIAVDDEPFALRLLEEEIRRVPFLKLHGVYGTPEEALEVLRSEAVDLLFLDIQMPGITGLDLLRRLENPPMVILTTAYEKYALEGFDLNVVDYLVKPFRADRFLKAVTKAYELFVLRTAAKDKKGDGFFVVYSEYKEYKLAYRDVLYIEGLKDYVKIFLEGKSHALLTRLNLKAVEGRLPAEQFCRVHNSFIVRLDRIDSFQKTNVTINNVVIPIGDKYADEFRNRYTTRS